MGFFSDWTDYVVIIGLALIALPAIIAGGWIIALFLGVAWLLVVKGIPFFLEFAKERHSGAAAAKRREKLSRKWERRDQ